MTTYTPKPIHVAVAASDTDLYVFPSSGVAWARAVTVNLANNGTTDITVRVYKLLSDATTKISILPAAITVHAGEVLQWTGSVVLNTNGEKLRAIASATNIDATGEVLEAST